MAAKKKITIETLALMVQRGFDEVSQKLETKADKADINLVLDRVDRLTDKIDEDRANQTATQRQVDRHEAWHHQTADKIGIKLQD
jgi:hypothetical protein